MGRPEEEGAGWRYAYEEGDRLLSVTGPEGIREASYGDDLWGNCTSRTDEKGCSTFYAYDLAGKLTRELVPVGEGPGEVRYRMTSYRYDHNSNLVQETRHGGGGGACTGGGPGADNLWGSEHPVLLCQER
ncbi:MAG: hypothetical protein ACI4D5_03130 [Kineothrix sp.]